MQLTINNWELETHSKIVQPYEFETYPRIIMDKYHNLTTNPNWQVRKVNKIVVWITFQNFRTWFPTIDFQQSKITQKTYYFLALVFKGGGVTVWRIISCMHGLPSTPFRASSTHLEMELPPYPHSRMNWIGLRLESPWQFHKLGGAQIERNEWTRQLFRWVDNSN